MATTRREFLAAAAVSGGALGFPAAARAQGSLETARIFTGFPAGSTPDVLARKVGDRLSRGYARSVVVENRVGAGGQLAVTATRGAPADGATVLLTPMSILGVYPHTYKKLPYDPIADLTAVSTGVTYDYGIGVGPAVPESVKTVADLMAWYKANPARASMGSPATGSCLHFVTVMLGRAAGVDITHVGYKGAGPAVQ